MKRIERINRVCEYCGCGMDVLPKSTRKFCNRECKNNFQIGKSPSNETKQKISKSVSGELNPNFNNKWSSTQKRIQSSIIKSKVDEAYREKCGSANKGKQFSINLIDRMHGHRDSSSYSHPHTEHTKQTIGKQSKHRHTQEGYTDNIIEKSLVTKEANGTIVRKENKKEFSYYWIEANWIKVNMWTLAMSGHQLLKEHGVFNPNTNSKGVVRDHIISRKFGFDNKVFPEILRHPTNCQILTISDNSKKRYIQNTTEELYSLFNRITTYTGQWKEQVHVLELIDQYKEGKRWKM